MARNRTASVDVAAEVRPFAGRAGINALLEPVSANVDDEANGSRGLGIGPGRPPGLIRERARRYFDERLERLALIAAGQINETVVLKDGSLVEVPPKLDTQIRAIATLGKFGLGTKFAAESAEKRELVVRVVDEAKERPRLE